MQFDFLTLTYLFLIALALAVMEIQIEGKHGWATQLPTWRYARPWLLRLTNGRPLTGYHIALGVLLLLFFHLPQAWFGWSRQAEAITLASFFFLTVFWDFLWFVLNPHYGLRRYSQAHVWWFPKRFLGLPVEYYGGLFLSALSYVALSSQDIATALSEWAFAGAIFLGYVVVTALLSLLIPRQ